MKWSISQLNQLQHKGLSIDEYVDVSDIKDIDSTIRGIDPVHVTGRADLSSAKATFHLTISGSMTLPCSRTLVDVNYPFNLKTTETFLLRQTLDYEADEEEIHLVQGDVVDLLPIIKENILLEIPMQVFSNDQHVEGAAPQEGKDWVVITEEDKRNQIDPRLAGLAKLFEDKKD
ncbi:DUF177 domain-containing protein [Bacillus timonensis]|nr:DUF177 domain-containing protein [Bacillus timonensis]